MATHTPKTWFDVTDPGEAAPVLADAHQRFEPLDLIVNNAGSANVSPIETTDDDDFRTQFETNFASAGRLSRPRRSGSDRRRDQRPDPTEPAGPGRRP